MGNLADFTLEELMLFIVGVLGALGGLFAIMFKSKCKTIKCCCIECIRDTELILKEDKLELGKTISNEEKKPINEEKVNEEKVNEPQNENN